MTRIFEPVDPLHKALDFHLRRQNVLSSNVANIDTPGFRPFDLVRSEDGMDVSPGMGLRETHIRHIPIASLENGEREVADMESTVPQGADGNSVSLDREMAKLGANSLRYEGASKMIAKTLGLLRYAANDGVGR